MKWSVRDGRYISIALVLTRLWRHSETMLFRNHWSLCYRKNKAVV